MSDVVQRLRDGLEDGAVDIADIMDAADAIERLNREVSALIAECQQQKVLLVNGATLTDAEREAVHAAMRSSPFCFTPEAKTLRALLARLA